MAIKEGPKRAPCFFVSHGAGPLAILRAPSQQPLIDLCKETAWVLDGSKGVIVVTAHWTADKTYISSAAKPPIYCDYFPVPGNPLPKEAWEIVYDAPGDPELARRIKESAERQGLEAELDDVRGWDHGVWTPLMLLRPQADLPVVQVSIPEGDKVIEQSFALGKALEPFRDEGWAILGSGHTYHNFKKIIEPIMGVPDAKVPPVGVNRAFEDKLEEVATVKDLKKRLDGMSKWKSFPEADEVQPPGNDEHFTPFLVTAAAGGSDPGKRLGEWEMFNTVSSSYLWA
ncbi:catalytic LigB subunit of putative aromatic ring-opening dioxygenase [Mytilinidion resinicola]|uniref:Catalytic LigB subunit of putative aromatic ring-opening dioxygenase n=1 Tax=Mytilinidion resinicola TaxID=574789 RepID=A0A6A6YP08_9PEZI|nr:catalytic LigB subunit of putative aromatic ring-opening dioxygenase [Mytilinidion resinicola]KAF2810612.1 catalytic LigB subunit of putative aromatic ring-opening dioxygenase [Mytilinidion resinicola]